MDDPRLVVVGLAAWALAAVAVVVAIVGALVGVGGVPALVLLFVGGCALVRALPR